MAPLSLIQVGAGLRGQSWAEIVDRTPGVRLAALVDGSRTVREWAVADLGVPTTRTLEQALASIESDAVLLVCLRPLTARSPSSRSRPGATSSARSRSRSTSRTRGRWCGRASEPDAT